MSANGATEALPMLLWCPECGARHIDVGEFATKVHHTHACQHCGMVWRPAIVATCGVQFLPGFKNELATGDDSPVVVRIMDMRENSIWKQK